MTNPTDPAAVEAWREAEHASWRSKNLGYPKRPDVAAAAVIQSYGDQREAAERERCADRIAKLEARVGVLSEALKVILGESQRSNGNIVHLRRCIGVQAGPALRDAGGA